MTSPPASGPVTPGTAAPLTAPDQAPRTTGSLRGLLREHNYRLYLGGQLISLTGTWIQRIAQDWLVLELSGGSAAALGIAAAMQWGPTLLLSLWAGTLADRFNRRRLLMYAATLLSLCSLACGTLVVTGAAQLWHVYLLCLLAGVVSAVETPARAAFTSELVDAADIPTAVAVNSVTFNIARITGPAVAGVLLTVTRTGPLFLIDGASFGAVLLGLALIRTRALRAGPAPGARHRSLIESYREVLRHPGLGTLIGLVFCLSAFGTSFVTILAVVSTSEFRAGPEGFGLLSSALAVGALVGATAATRYTLRRRPASGVLVRIAACLAVLLVVLAVQQVFWAFALVLLCCGFVAQLFLPLANSTVQLSVPAGQRGRVMALYGIAVVGAYPIGSVITGWITDRADARWAIAGGGVALLLATGLSAAVLRRATRHPAAEPHGEKTPDVHRRTDR